jgi:hypothetical protein
MDVEVVKGVWMKLMKLDGCVVGRGGVLVLMVGGRKKRIEGRSRS